MTTKRKGFGVTGYRNRYRLENLAGEVIAEANFTHLFVQQVEALGYAKVGQTEQGFYEVDTPNGVMVHPDGHRLPEPVFEGVEVPVREPFGRRLYKLIPTNEEVTQ